MNNKLVEKLTKTSQLNQSQIIVCLNPSLAKLPLPIQRYDDPFLPFGKAVVNATKDLVCGYILDLASYLALGAAGAVSLERTARYISANHIPCIIHGPFSGHSYSLMCDQTAFGVDGLTLKVQGDLQYYLENPPYGALVVDDRVDMNSSIPIYASSRSQVCVSGTDNKNIVLHVTDDNVLYSNRGDDFELIIRQRVEALRARYDQ